MVQPSLQMAHEQCPSQMHLSRRKQWRDCLMARSNGGTRSTLARLVHVPPLLLVAWVVSQEAMAGHVPRCHGLCMSRHCCWRLGYMESFPQLVLAAPSPRSHVTTLLASGDGGINGLTITSGGTPTKIDPLR